MFVNNLRLAFRQLYKNRTYALINIMGLAIGIAASLLIYRILRYELSFNSNFKNADRIVRVLMKVSGGESGTVYQRGMPLPAMTELENSMPLFEQKSRVREDWPTITVPGPAGAPPLKKMQPGEGQISYFAEPGIFDIFDFKWLAGDAENALKDAGSIVLTRKVAEYCFDNAANAIGKTVLLDNGVPCMVRGVIENLPPNCDFQLFTLASYATLRANTDLYNFPENDWGSTSSNDQYYALLADKNRLEAARTALLEVGKAQFNRDNPQNLKACLDLEPLPEVHYNEEVGVSSGHTISKARLWVLATIGFLVLLMACFNFINLATALASMRAREVGVRKAIGGARTSLMAQFMTETALITAFSLVIGLAIAQLCSPLLQFVSELPDDRPFLSDSFTWMFLAIVGCSVALLSGIYPSFILSGYQPIRALKSNYIHEKVGGISLRKGLVVAQFAIAQTLVIGAIVTISQMNYVRNMDMGFKKDLILGARFNGDSVSLSKLDGLKQRLLQIPSVEQVSFSSDRPASGSTWSSNFSFARSGSDAPFSTSMKFCDQDFQNAYGLTLLSGRWLEPSDTAKEYIVNETLCRKLGIVPAESAVGKELRLGAGRWRTVVGVVKDFHTHSAHQQHEALVMACKKEFYSHLGVKIRPENIPATVEAVRKVYDEAFPEQVFDPKFLNESIAEFYQAEGRFSDFCKGIAFLAVIIGCLGLFGLATHAAARRTKEIGVRKVLGATVGNITRLLTFDFLKLVALAIVVATPIAYFLMQEWLSDFAFRIDIQWWMFASACLGAIAIAFVTVSYQSIRAAVANPVQSLRSE